MFPSLFSSCSTRGPIRCVPKIRCAAPRFRPVNVEGTGLVVGRAGGSSDPSPHHGVGRAKYGRCPYRKRREELRAVVSAWAIALLFSFVLLTGPVDNPIRTQGGLRLSSVSTPISAVNWTNMNPPVAPTARENFATAYDSVADRVVLFGGYDGTSDGSDETWAYYLESNLWSNLAPTVHPDSGWTHRAAYDSHAQRIIMFGGFDGVTGTVTNETWAFDLANNTWANRQPSDAPSVRSRQAMAYDVRADQVILFGGLGQMYESDTWAYDFARNTWTNLSPATPPPARRNAGMVYDSVADRLILFGGVDLSRQTIFNDTWSYDFNANTWTNLTPPTGPSGRYGFGFIYDPVADVCALFGGLTSDRMSDETWAYNLASNSWTILSADPHPAARWSVGMAYDSQSDRAVLFSGRVSSGAQNDTWALLLQPAPPGAPGDLAATPGNGFINLTWTAPPDNGMSRITNYRVYRGPDASNVSLLSVVADVRSYSDTNVSNGVPYVYRVSAVNSIGEGPESPAITAAPDGEPPVTTPSFAGTRGLDGWFTSAVVVTLRATDDNSGVASTWYQVGSGGWTQYSNPFTFSEEGFWYLYYYSVDKAGNKEERGLQRPWSLAIDTVPPVTLAILDGTQADPYWFRSTVNVTLEASDDSSGVVSVHYRLDGNVSQEYAGPFEVTDGRHVLEYFATDDAGLTEASHSVSFGVDATPPATGLTLAGPLRDNGWYVGPVVVSIQAADATSGATVTYRLDAGPWVPYAGSFSVSTDGPHAVDYQAVDGVGNVATGSGSFSIDATPPRSVLSVQGTLGANGWFVSEAKLSLGSHDEPSGVAAIRVWIDGGAAVVYTSPITLTDGIHSIAFAATDAAGNIEVTQTATILVDASAPLVHAGVLGTAGSGGWYTSAVTVSLIGTDAPSGLASMMYRVDSGAWNAYTSALRLEGDGAHLLEFSATDVAGNEAPIRSETIRIDTTAPHSEASLSGDAGDHGWYRSSVTVALSAVDATSDVASLSYRQDAETWARYDGPFTVGPGVHTILFDAKDIAGLEELARSGIVRVDGDPPMLGGLRPSGTVSSNRVDVSWSATDDGSGIDHYEISVDNGTWTRLTDHAAAELSLADGSHTITVRAVDVAGNAAEDSVRITVDTSAFSVAGPYGGLPTLGIITGIAVLVSMLEWLRRRRRA